MVPEDYAVEPTATLFNAKNEFADVRHRVLDGQSDYWVLVTALPGGELHHAR